MAQEWKEAMNWRFKKLTPNDTRVNATHLEFFRDEALANPVDALVREDIQNRLDARAAGEDGIKVCYRMWIAQAVNGHQQKEPV